MSTKQNVLPIAGVLSGALVWGLIWYPYRVLQQAGVSGTTATLLTYAVAMLCGAFILPRVWRNLQQADGWLLGLVLSSGWANFGYVLGMLQGEVMRVLLLFYLAPVWTILFSYALLGERLNRYGFLVIGLSLLGAMVMLWRPQLGVPVPQNLAEWMGLTAGMSFALANVISRRAHALSVETKSFGIWFGVILLALPYSLWQADFAGQFVHLNAQNILLLVLLGVVLCAISFAVQYGVAHLTANRAVLLFMFELVFAAISSYFLANEAMHLRDWLGAALIVSASLLSGRLAAAEPTPA